MVKAINKKQATREKELVQLGDYLNSLKHPLKKEIEALRKIILSADENLLERIKWNAPSYYYVDDILTFNPRMQDKVHLIFHHPFIEQIKSALLEGDYKGRRMTYFSSMKEISAGKKELQNIIRQLIAMIEKAR